MTERHTTLPELKMHGGFIRRHIGPSDAEIESGHQDPESSLIKNAPHSLHLLTLGSWDRPYPLEVAFFPSPATRRDKYWPPVGRVDNVQGDKTLVCNCPPIDYYEEEVQTP